MRKELLTHPKLQAKWLALILLLAALSAALVFASIDRAIAIAGESRNAAFLTADWLRESIRVPFYVASAVALTGAGCVALFLLHTLFGPLRKLENAFVRVQNGDLKSPLHTRDADELQELASGFRTMQESLRSRVLKDRERALALKSVVDGALATLPAGPSKLREDLSFVSKELADLTSQFEL